MDGDGDVDVVAASMDQGVLSASGVLPAIAGMMIGQRLRQKLSEDLFKRVFFWALLVLGFYIAATALGGRL